MTSAHDETAPLLVSGESQSTRPTADSSLSFKTACYHYAPSIFWSIFFSLGTITIAFNNQVISNLLATLEFRKAFGHKFGDDYIVAATVQMGLYIGASLGQVVTPILITYPLDWIGRKKTFGLVTIATIICVFVQFTAKTGEVLLAGELIAGFVLGAYSLLGPLYASEVCPLALRGVLTAYTQLCWVLGQLLANIATKVFSERNDSWAYKGPFAIQWLLPTVILAGLAFAPESPWYFAANGRLEDAEDALKCLSSSHANLKKDLDLIVETLQSEQKADAQASYWDCFTSPNRRRTEIAVGVYSSQVLSGCYIIGYGTYFFELAGLPVRRAFDMGIAFLGIGLLGSNLTWLFILKSGRRKVEVGGLACLSLAQLLIGLLDVWSYNRGSAWGQSVLLLIWNFAYNISIGSFAFVIMCECSSVQLRSKTIAIATAVQAALGIAMTFLIPYLINPDQLNLRGKFGFVFAALGGLTCVWAYFRVPETKNRTFEELDMMFQLNVPTRQFESFKVPE